MQPEQEGFKLAPNERLFLGEGLFETIKVLKSKPCFAELHWQRLRNSAQALGFSFTLSLEAWRHSLLAKIQQERLLDGGIKAIWTGGEASRGLISEGQNSQLLLHAFSFQTLFKPVRLKTASWLRDANNPLYQLKTINYLEAILARRQAMQEGADDALFFNTQHCVTEASCANIFFLQEGRLLTPAQTEGVLPGITRSRILNHCRHLNLAYAEVSITRELIKQSEAVFLTNALQGIHYVAAIDQHEFLPNHPTVSRLIAVLKEEEQTMLHNQLN
ncbi:aminotransferase class IV [Legionella sp. km772]|uniref:aminotransferase class IV n=1 Tax=Legionella sp. km772 TaxID=2498111 RepID=UPI000F8F3B24|nr:aminotransferase class IV [Legionella sp. km772]RUR12424.1 4-amino-4-deoxychorismate lyase [Legionella sp. km772]